MTKADPSSPQGTVRDPGAGLPLTKEQIEELRVDLLARSRLPADGGNTVHGIQALCDMALRTEAAERERDAARKNFSSVSAIIFDAVGRDQPWRIDDAARALVARVLALEAALRDFIRYCETSPKYTPPEKRGPDPGHHPLDTPYRKARELLAPAPDRPARRARAADQPRATLSVAISGRP